MSQLSLPFRKSWVGRAPRLDDQEKLRALVDVAERPEYDETFEKLAYGQLSDAEVEALRTSSDLEVRRLYELFRPLDGNARRRFDDLVAKLTPDKAREGAQKDPKRLAITLLQPRRMFRRVIQIGLPLAVAAGLLIYLTTVRPPQGTGTGGIAVRTPPSPLKLYSHHRVVERNASGGTLLGSQAGKEPEVQILSGACWRLSFGTSPDGQLPEGVRALFVSETAVTSWDATFLRQDNDRLAPAGGCANPPSLVPGSWTLFVFSGSKLPSPMSTPAAVSAACSKSPQETVTWRCDKYPIRVFPSPPPAPEQP